MKVAVITRHAITNYGSLLQAIATQEIIEKLGIKCEIINYIRKDESFWNSEKTLIKKKKEWNNNPLKKLIYLALRSPESIIAGKRFSKERKKYLNLGKRYLSAEELRIDSPKADIYMTGSDQVWGPVIDGSYDDSYCLSFVEGKKIAYASSFGRVDITKEMEGYYKKWLSKYDSITVREDSAVDFLKTIDIKGRQVLDPTLLLDKQFWKKYSKPIKKQNYILVYQLHNNKSLNDYAEKVSKEKGLPLIRISPFLHQITRPGKFVWCPKIEKFLSYIMNAECLITDSFHGTAFAINFNISFVEVLPNNNTDTRNMSILKLTRLTDRVLKDANNTELASEQIDFSYANSVIEEQRIHSIRFLKQMLE